MDDATTIAEVRARLAPVRRAARRIALVPTMGALHAGHLALVEAARTAADCVVMSVFVNPLQFAPGEDFARYPRDLARDRSLARAAGVDLLFAPSPGEMYPAGAEVRIVAGATAARWEGAVRPGHFDGVLTVVAKLLHIVEPAVAVFGQKDIQQVTLVRRMIADLDFPVALFVAPTVREPDGLAMSSRNAYLAPEDREIAAVIPRALRAALDAWHAGERDAAMLQERVAAELSTVPALRADYIAVVEPEGLAPVTVAAPDTIIAVAVRVGATRLIDNVILRESADPHATPTDEVQDSPRDDHRHRPRV